MNNKPIADFTITSTGCVADVVSYNTPKSSGVRWLWDLGNGSNLDLTTETHGVVYAQPGNYNVKLRTISDIGCISEETTKVLTITTKPVANFNFSAVRCTDTDITFTTG